MVTCTNATAIGYQHRHRHRHRHRHVAPSSPPHVASPGFIYGGAKRETLDVPFVVSTRARLGVFFPSLLLKKKRLRRRF